MSDKELAEKPFPSVPGKVAYMMTDYTYVCREMQQSGVTLTLLWLEYCDQRNAQSIPCQSTPFNKYYSDYLNRFNATMHPNYKPVR